MTCHEAIELDDAHHRYRYETTAARALVAFVVRQTRDGEDYADVFDAETVSAIHTALAQSAECLVAEGERLRKLVKHIVDQDAAGHLQPVGAA